MASKEGIAAAMSRTFNVIQTATKMAKDRNYIPGVTPKTIEEFRATMEAKEADEQGNLVETGRLLRKRMTIPCEHRSTGEKMLIMFNDDKKLSVKALQEIRTTAQHEGAARIILILTDKPNPLCEREIARYQREEHGVKVQYFLEEDLYVNITEHELVPQHTPLEPEEQKAVLQAHSLSIDMLPRMLVTDPVSKYFGLERGRVVRIKRKSESAGEYVTYRQII